MKETKETSLITKKDLRSVFLRSFTMQSSWSFDKMMAYGFMRSCVITTPRQCIEWPRTGIMLKACLFWILDIWFWKWLPCYASCFRTTNISAPMSI